MYSYFVYRRTGLKVDDIARILEEDDSGETRDANVVFYPDAVEPLTDEDSEEEEDNGGRGMDVNHLGRGILSQFGEIDLNDIEDDLPDLLLYSPSGEIKSLVRDETVQEEEVEEELQAVAGPSHSRKRKSQVVQEVLQLARKKNTEREWYKDPVASFGQNITPFQPKPAKCPVPEDCLLPYDFFRLFVTPEFVNDVATKSKLYCVRKGHPEKESVLNTNNIYTSIGIMFLTGYNAPANKDLFWSDREDTQNRLVKNAITKRNYLDVLSYTYFVLPEDLDVDDPFWKVRPLFNNINNKARDLLEQPEMVSVDESIVRYFGPHPLKQCIREKPER